MKFIRWIARERAVIAGVFVALGDIAVELARSEDPSWRSVLPIVAGFIARWFVTPTTKAA